jgi:hypothetical protein
MMQNISDILWRNMGQMLTPEMILGIIQGAEVVSNTPFDLTGIAPKEYRGYVFFLERYQDVLHELKPLHAAHWQETEKYRHAIPLNPNYEKFIDEEKSGNLLLFTIRKDGELVGQSTMKLHRSMHSQTLVANEDSLFLRKDHRGGVMMLFFLKYMDEVLTQAQVREVRVSSKLENSADKLLMRAGFKPFATQLVKMLGVEHA